MIYKKYKTKHHKTNMPIKCASFPLKKVSQSLQNKMLKLLIKKFHAYVLSCRLKKQSFRTLEVFIGCGYIKEQTD